MFCGPPINYQELDIKKPIQSSPAEILPDYDGKKVTTQKKKILSNSWKLNLIIFSMAELFVGFTFSLLAPFYTEEATKKGLSVTQTGMVGLMLF